MLSPLDFHKSQSQPRYLRSDIGARGRPPHGTLKRVEKSVTVFACSISCTGDGCQAAEGHRPPWCGGMERPHALSPSRRSWFRALMPCFCWSSRCSPSTSRLPFGSKTLGSRALRLHAGGGHCRQIFAWTQAPGAGLSLRPHRYLVRARPMPMH